MGGPTKGDNAAHPVDVGPAAPPRARPRRDDFRPFGRWVPWLVPAFVVANFALFALTMYVNDCPSRSSSCVGTALLGRFAFQPLTENPLLGPSRITLDMMGALDRDKVVEGHQGWRLITCIWLHGGVIHVLANMLGLLFVGIRLEQEFGFVRIGLLYITSGFGGSVLSALLIQSRNSVGASGALFGLLGAMLSELITNWTIYSNKLAALLTLVFIIAINLAIGFLPHVDNAAHIGGFITGFLLGFVILIRPQFAWVNRRNAPLGIHTGSVKHKHNVYQYIFSIISAILLIAGFTVGLVMLFREVNLNDYCSWCHYLSCIPTSKSSCQPQVVNCILTEIRSAAYFNLACEGSGKTQDYLKTNTSDTGTSEWISELCAELCG